MKQAVVLQLQVKMVVLKLQVGDSYGAQVMDLARGHREIVELLVCSQSCVSCR